ncbi:MAG: tRNA pseudouridine(38-40) synthase TruA [Paracholeplasma sp.]|nr:tRNA pseudouridine(38-40) synthase TruA [Paracholeplasma sp.]MDY3196355.1 tRNA pseudouridine(38-40) synthase TruA [Paracholeplasma sp.]
MRYKLIVSYDGSNYHGFQKQNNGLGVEEVIETALFQITKEETNIVGSGRTDRGVHAYGQVCHFDSSVNLQESNWTKALNTFLPSDIRVISVTEVSDDFHARFHAKKKKYSYVITRKYDLFKRNHQTYIHYPLDVSLMKEALMDFVGKHDFYGFSTYVINKPTIKEIFEATLIEDGDKIVISFVADGFLKYMVRSMVGTLIDIGRGKLSKDIVKEVLESKDRSKAGKTAKPEGLYLEYVLYDE